MHITKAMRIFAWCTTCIPSGISLKQQTERYRIIFGEKPGAALLGRSPPNRHQCSANLFQQDTCLGTICVSSTSFIRLRLRHHGRRQQRCAMNQSRPHWPRSSCNRRIRPEGAGAPMDLIISGHSPAHPAVCINGAQLLRTRSHRCIA